MTREFSYIIKSAGETVDKAYWTDFAGLESGSKQIRVGSDNWFLPEKYEKFAEEIFNFQARPDDVYICTLPRSGTTWTQEMVWLICNGLNYEAAKKIPLMQRFPYLE